MSTRRSGRATKEVKYMSASEGSDFEDKKKKTRKTTTTTKKTKKPAIATTTTTTTTTTRKKAPKRAAESDNDDAPTNGNDPKTTTTPPKPKRQKKDPAVLAAEAQEKQAKADKAAHKKAWQDWLASHDGEGGMLEEEPGKEESITQTDALKNYGLKKEELKSLLRFEKKSPLYGGTMKLFREEHVRRLAFRKIGTLEGCQGNGEEVMRRGEEKWAEEHRDRVDVSEEKTAKDETKEKQRNTVKAEGPKKEKTPRQKWSAYVSTHSIDDDDDDSNSGKLAKEPGDAINQTESKNKYSLTPQDLTCLPFFPKKNPAYGNNMKLFKESDVKSLAYRKAAVLAGVEDNGKDDGALLEMGKEIFETQGDSDEDEKVGDI